MSDFATHYITARRFAKKNGIVGEERRGLLFGVQGPDFLFYLSGEQNKFGSAFHKIVPKEFFQKAVAGLLLEDKNSVAYQLKRGYLLGLLLHYVGDSCIHPYIGWLEENCNEHNFRFIHMQNECELDFMLYFLEYGKPTSSFAPTKEAKLDSVLTKVALEIWDCQDMCKVTKSGFVHGTKRLWKLAGYFFAGKFKRLMKFVEPKSVEGFLMCHYKEKANPKILNDDHSVWQNEGEDVNLSVFDILDQTLEIMQEEYAKILEAENGGASYEFTLVRSFDGKIILL